jgi:hypothetical protein
MPTTPEQGRAYIRRSLIYSKVVPAPEFVLNVAVID